MGPQQQAPTERPQPARQEDEWSLPIMDERRDDTERQQTIQMPPPAAPPPTEERLFTDWSSEGSPRERTNQQIQSVRSVGSRRTVSQTEQTLRGSGDDEVSRQAPGEVMTTSSAQIQINQVGARLMDPKTNTSEIEISQGIQVPSSSSEFSSHDMFGEGSTVRPHVPIIMPQLDGPASVCTRRKQPLPIVRRTTIPGGGYPNESNNDSHDNRFQEDRRYPGKKRYHHERNGRLPDRENNQDQF